MVCDCCADCKYMDVSFDEQPCASCMFGENWKAKDNDIDHKCWVEPSDVAATEASKPNYASLTLEELEAMHTLVRNYVDHCSIADLYVIKNFITNLQN